MSGSLQRLRAAAAALRGTALGVALGVGWSCTNAATALASPNYPDTIDEVKGTHCPRPTTRCLICHLTAAGGEGTAKRPFAITLQDYGLTKGKSARQLTAALEALPDDVDSDGDGAPDQAELAACMNPSGEELSDGPGFGCGAQLSPQSRQPDGLLLCCALSATVAVLGLARAGSRRSPGRR